MYIIIGLGNPEPEYSKTRHNMGFDTINKLSQELNINVNNTKFKSLYGTGTINNEKVVLVKPQTYMNLSGEAVREIVNFYKVKNEQIVVIYDDIDIPKGIIKIRKKGGPGNHNGMKSIVSNLSTEEFIRIRVGIGTPTYKNDMINYVLGKIADEEYEILEQGIKKAAQAVTMIINDGIDYAMNKCN